tara:strand:+ start:66 stop:254 length:189 start_codon:yes stop_codon:yes gene_type:complete
MSENMTDWKNLEFLLVILFDIVIIIFVVNWFQKKFLSKMQEVDKRHRKKLTDSKFDYLDESE